jgi:hypothetical protein
MAFPAVEAFPLSMAFQVVEAFRSTNHDLLFWLRKHFLSCMEAFH